MLEVGTNFNLGDTNHDSLFDPGEVWMFTSVGVSSGSTINWDAALQKVLSSTDTSGAGLTPGFAHDVVGTPNTFTDNIFTGGGSKDVNGISQWQWKTQMPQDNADIADAFAATYADPASNHTLLFGALDRYAANGATTVGFWFLQQSVTQNSNGTFNGRHTDGDVLLVLDFTVGGSTPVVKVFRWSGTDANGTLVAVNAPAGSTFARVNSGPVSVPWEFIDKRGFDTPQAGEFLKVGLDYNAVFGGNAPRFASFLAETRSLNSANSTLSDYALGGVNTVGTFYKVKAGQYSNVVTVIGVDQVTDQVVSATDTNYHRGIVNPGGQPQFFAGAAQTPAPTTANLGDLDLQNAVAAAIGNLAAVGFDVNGLAQVEFVLADLPESLLGWTYANTIWIDVNALGYGWFTDVSAASNAWFTEATGASEVQAAQGSPAYGHVDLLTVVTHALGHVLGFASIDAGVLDHDWMTATLGTGTRRHATGPAIEASATLARPVAPERHQLAVTTGSDLVAVGSAKVAATAGMVNSYYGEWLSPAATVLPLNNDVLLSDRRTGNAADETLTDNLYHVLGGDAGRDGLFANLTDGVFDVMADGLPEDHD